MDASQATAPGLRERKSAATRLALAESLSRRLRDTPLAEILVEDLAADANVSRVTFFNYFPTKEHALDLVLVIWLFELNAAIARKGLRGARAIVEVFENVGAKVAEAPEAYMRMMASMATRPVERPLPELGRVERAALAPDLAEGEVETKALGELFVQAVQEARRHGEIQMEGTAYEIAHYLGALMQGASLLGRSSPDTDYRRLFARHVRRALGIGFGRTELSDAVGVPLTPERWRRKRGGKR